MCGNSGLDSSFAKIERWCLRKYRRQMVKQREIVRKRYQLSNVNKHEEDERGLWMIKFYDIKIF